MAHEKFPVEVLTPEGEVFNEEVEMLSTRTAVGSIGVLANHTPLLAILDPTELRQHRSEGDVVSFAQGEGYLQVGSNRALVLVEDAIPPEDLDAGHLRERLSQAEEELSRCEEGTEEHAKGVRSKRRWEAFIEIAEGS